MRYLFLVRQAPYRGVRSQEALDLLLTLAAFDQAVDVMLLDDGVWQLHRGQQPETLTQKNCAAMWQVLEMYGIQSPWVESESLRERNLDTADLVLPVRLVPRAKLAEVFREYDRVLGD
jgi:tRNA 2-thiouridine synthesizing protein C